jgi:putative tRNA adenosine deaminase-associated protein
MAQQADFLEFDPELVDFAVAVYQEDGRWGAAGLPPHVAETLAGFLAAVRQQGSEGPTIGLAGLCDEYFVAARLVGRDVRLFLSDAAVAADERIAGELVERLDPHTDLTRLAQGPIGDVDIFGDLGLDPLELTVVCERLLSERDLGLVDAVGQIAARLGFGDQFAQAAWQSVAAEDWRGT